MPEDPASMTDAEWEAFEARRRVPPPADRRPYGDETCPVCGNRKFSDGEVCLCCLADFRDREIERERKKQLAEQGRSAKGKGNASKALARWWNKARPVGTAVRYWAGTREGDGVVSTTRSQAWVADGRVIVLVAGCRSCVPLTHVEVIVTGAVVRRRKRKETI